MLVIDSPLSEQQVTEGTILTLMYALEIFVSQRAAIQTRSSRQGERPSAMQSPQISARNARKWCDIARAPCNRWCVDAAIRTCFRESCQRFVLLVRNSDFVFCSLESQRRKTSSRSSIWLESSSTASLCRCAARALTRERNAIDWSLVLHICNTYLDSKAPKMIDVLTSSQRGGILRDIRVSRFDSLFTAANELERNPRKARPLPQPSPQAQPAKFPAQPASQPTSPPQSPPPSRPKAAEKQEKQEKFKSLRLLRFNKTLTALGSASANSSQLPQARLVLQPKDNVIEIFAGHESKDLLTRLPLDGAKATIEMEDTLFFLLRITAPQFTHFLKFQTRKEMLKWQERINKTK